MFLSSINTLENFKEVLLQLPEGKYHQPCSTLSHATIGQHTRHIIELYQCLIQGYDGGEVCYDKRERNKRIEQEIAYAIEQVSKIQNALEKPDKKIVTYYELGENEVRLESNYYREVMYNLEHTIHHEALIKVGILQLTDVPLPDSFGVAPSTMQYRKQCVQ